MFQQNRLASGSLHVIPHLVPPENGTVMLDIDPVQTPLVQRRVMKCGIVGAHDRRYERR